MHRIANKYDVIRALGQGATGWVYLVRHKELGQEYAVKVLNALYSTDDSLVMRFRTEATVLTRLSHPGSVGLRDFGRTDDGQYYLATDVCPGITLGDYLDLRHRLSPLDALIVGKQMLDVLHAAHELGIVHRDVKPDNVMIDVNEHGVPHVRVLDFGIAKLRDALSAGPNATQEGCTVGTPTYMSPEQAAGESDLDGRADIYSVGVILYELLSGDVPFEGSTTLQTMLLQMTAPPPPFDSALGIPQAVEHLVARALAKHPDDRYSSALVFSQACEHMIGALLDGSVPMVTSDPTAAQRVRHERSKRETRVLCEPKRILCIDDDPGTLGMLGYILKREGFSVDALSSGKDLAKLICDEQVRFVVCDFNMPGLSGINVCRLLKRRLPEVTFVLFSGAQEDELAEAARSCGADAWISKGWPVEEWLGRIKRLYSQRTSNGGIENSSA